MLKLIVMLTLLAMAAAMVKNFNGYKVFRLTPNNQEQIISLRNFSDVGDEYNFWNGPTTLPNATADLMVAPEKVSEFQEIMNTTGTPYTTLIEDVQVLIEAVNPSVNSTRERRQLPSGFDWMRYHTLDEIYSFLDSLALAHPDKVRVIFGGSTFEGRYIKGVKLSFKPYNPAIFIEGGMHAREWISISTVTYLVNELLNNQDPEVRELAENSDWYIFPVVNPDGYVYTHTHDRFWLKTRKPSTPMCNGSDPNRNWGYKWMEGGANSNPCFNSYAGSAPFSEVETESLSRFISSISYNLYAYISFHSYSQLLLFPYGHTEEHLDNYNQSYAIATEAIEALSTKFGTEYQIGNHAEKMYIFTGSSVDWVKHTFNISLVYTYELRDKGKYGFLLPVHQIIPTGQEVLDSLLQLFTEAGSHGIPRRP